MSDVLFKECTNSEYSSLTPDSNTFYKVQDSSSDDPDVYLGTTELSRTTDIFISENILYITPPTRLDSCTYSIIADIVQSGQAENYWSVGDTTSLITLNGIVSTYGFDNYKCKAILIGFDHNKNLETNGKSSITLQFGQDENGVNICFCDPNYDGGGSTTQTGFRMNYSNTNAGGWESSWMRNDICPQFLELLPTDLQNVIGTVTKYTDNVGDGSGDAESNITATQDKVFLLSYHECGFTSTYANSYEANYTEPYSEMYSSREDRARYKYKHFDTSSKSAWWNRSPGESSSHNFCNVNTAGSDNTSIAYNSFGFSPAIAIY